MNCLTCQYWLKTIIPHRHQCEKHGLVKTVCQDYSREPGSDDEPCSMTTEFGAGIAGFSAKTPAKAPSAKSPAMSGSR